jgi:hypothetical protein
VEGLTSINVSVLVTSCSFFKGSNAPRCESGSSVSIVSDYGLDDRTIGFRSPAEANGFSFSLCVQTGSGAHPASSTMGTGGPFPGSKARPRHEADHSTPSSAEVKNEYELYLLPQALPWRVVGLLYLYANVFYVNFKLYYSLDTWGHYTLLVVRELFLTA